MAWMGLGSDPRPFFVPNGRDPAAATPRAALAPTPRPGAACLFFVQGSLPQRCQELGKVGTFRRLVVDHQEMQLRARFNGAELR